MSKFLLAIVFVVLVMFAILNQTTKSLIFNNENGLKYDLTQCSDAIPAFYNVDLIVVDDIRYINTQAEEHTSRAPYYLWLSTKKREFSVYLDGQETKTNQFSYVIPLRQYTNDNDMNTSARVSFDYLSTEGISNDNEYNKIVLIDSKNCYNAYPN